MTEIRIATENPVIEQWRLLSQFSYPSNIQGYLKAHGNDVSDNENVELVAGSIRQGEAYFKAAEAAPLDISPLLLYYGATNLLMGASVLLTNQRSNIKTHGMSLANTIASRIADVQVLPINPEKGALQLFANLFSVGCTIANGEPWSMGEILGSIPDLKHDFENHYPDIDYYIIPVEIVIDKNVTLERIPIDELRRFHQADLAISQIPGLSDAYLTPQYTQNYIILFLRRNSTDIGTYSISGRKYLQIAHMKRNQQVNPKQLILMYMGLFVLGSLLRYHPQVWNPFVRSDTTGEKYVIEKFTSTCQRYFPNLILNYISGKRIQFVSETEGIRDLTSSFGKRELQIAIRDILQEMRGSGEMQ